MVIEFCFAGRHIAGGFNHNNTHADESERLAKLYHNAGGNVGSKPDTDTSMGCRYNYKSAGDNYFYRGYIIPFYWNCYSR